jgi:hypothetical protein
VKQTEWLVMIPANLDTLLTRAVAAAALTAAGYRVSKATLASKATRGGGPRYRLFGRQPLYRWGDLIDWVESRCTEPERVSALDPGTAALAPHCPACSTSWRRRA